MIKAAEPTLWTGRSGRSGWSGRSQWSRWSGWWSALPGHAADNTGNQLVSPGWLTVLSAARFVRTERQPASAFPRSANQGTARPGTER
ncbi:hypothetical protein AMIS_67780 [Actinoplanes missouriensis 431]|uniref:Uncharacterized protein n=1 Tax=Actinoplanes missouriensis (strain ATCC 14538 / DSM 43046 / CBS 188.64 / JCM 3121 / NBRC 102363 / NCIMB 12654 / NRRL B-3342 / UNCC 431) TaxID=512565 RepID=I0HG61_ACTM4|nr:hypothetical protein AMIS_67780 [Actinoplanes missouriensis 431]